MTKGRTYQCNSSNCKESAQEIEFLKSFHVEAALVLFCIFWYSEICSDCESGVNESHNPLERNVSKYC